MRVTLSLEVGAFACPIAMHNLTSGPHPNASLPTSATPTTTPTYCFCRRPEWDTAGGKLSGAMVECESGDACSSGQWFHVECVSYEPDESHPTASWYCHSCRPRPMQPPGPILLPPPPALSGGSGGAGCSEGDGGGSGVGSGQGSGGGAGTTTTTTTTTTDKRRKLTHGSHTPGKRAKTKTKKAQPSNATAADIHAIVSSDRLEALSPLYAAR